MGNKRQKDCGMTEMGEDMNTTHGKFQSSFASESRIRYPVLNRLCTPHTALGILVLLLAVLGSWDCSNVEYSGKVETLKIGVPPLEQNALLYVANHKRFFAGHGLHIVIKDYDSGVTAISGMLKGEVDIAEAAEFPFVRAIFQKEEIRVIACNDKFENDYIVGRKDRGITKISDLKGKRIGVTLKTINEFYLGRFLALNGINIKNITLIDVKPAQFVDAIASDDVDAIIAWQPYIDRIQKKVNGIVVWPAQSGQAVYGAMVCSLGWLTQHNDTVKRFLKSLKKAEDYLIRHPDEAKAIVQKRLNYDDSYISSVWPQHHFILSLGQTLIVAMKDEAQWMINNNLTGEKQIPDFANYIYVDALKAVKSKAVNIIR
jgi:NitT/TauT family transport system substrate-binding protein